LTIENRPVSPVTRHGIIDKGPLSSRTLLDLSLFSTCMFVFAALFLQFLLTLHTAFLLKLYSISFQYSLFAINYMSESSYNPFAVNSLSEGSSKWTEDQIYLVFGSGPLILSAAGFLLLFFLKRSLNAGWKTKLALTWMAFLMVNALPGGIIAGVFFYEGFGVFFQWFISSTIARAVIAVMVLLFLVIFSRFWQWMFLKSSYTAAFLDNGDHQRIFLKNVFLKPWIYGFCMLLLFNWPFSNLFWRAFLVSLGYLALSLFDQNTPMHLNPMIRKSDKKIFTTRFQPVYFALVLAFIWVADYAIINF
jgi:hypothetical protein